VVFSLAGPLLAAQEPAVSTVADTAAQEVSRVQELITAARNEVRLFRQAQPTVAWESSPAKAKVQALWDYGREHAMSAAGGKATSETLQILHQAGRDAEVTAKVDTLGAQEPAWGEVLWVLLQTAESSGDWSAFIAKTQWVIANTGDATLRAKLWFTLGRVYRETGRREEAEAAFAKAAETSPSQGLADSSKGAIYEMHNLNQGQDAPLFTVQALSGDALSLEKLRGQVVVLDFWGSA